MIDTAERLRLLDGWLRLEFLPSLPAHVRVVIATRDAPGAVWRASFGELLCTIAPRAAVARRRRRGAARRRPRRAPGRVGQPLRARPSAVAPARRVRRTRAPGRARGRRAADRRAGARGALPRRARPGDARRARRRLGAAPRTLSLLGALLRAAPAGRVRAARRAAVRGARPRGPRRPRHGARDRARCFARATRCATAATGRRRGGRSDGAGRARRGPLVVGRRHDRAVDEPLVREAFFPSAVQHYAVETARAGDGTSDRGDHRASRAGRGRARAPWWDAVPSAFRVARSPRGDVVAFTILCELSRRTAAAARRRSAVRRLAPHLRAQPVAAGERDAARAAALAWATGAAPSPCLRRCCATRARLAAAGPSLRRVYSAAPRRGAARAARADRLRAGCADLNRGLRLPPDRLDLGPESVVSWLSSLAARDLELTRHGPRRRRARAARRRPPDHALQARVRRAALPARPRGPAGRARRAAARRVGLRVDRRLERRRRRDLRPAAQARRSGGRAADGPRRRLPPASVHRWISEWLPASRAGRSASSSAGPLVDAHAAGRDGWPRLAGELVPWSAIRSPPGQSAAASTGSPRWRGCNSHRRCRSGRRRACR